MIVLPAILLSFSSQQLEIAKEQLFTEWTTSSRIANVTFGLPTDIEVDSVALFVEELWEDIMSANAGVLSSSERQLEVPFLMAMLDGITMEYSKKHAQKCLAHLDKLDIELDGIAASRVWRMRHRAAVILGDEEGANIARNEFAALHYRHPEDEAIFTLYDIQQAFEQEGTKSARDLYNSQGNKLTSKAANYLRIPFAHGYARVSTTQSEALHGWFSLADWLVEYGYDRSIVDSQLVRWFSRLHNPPVNIEVASIDPRIASLALRLEVSRSLQKNSAGVLEKLMEFARAGDGRSAERVLEQGDSQYVEEAISLLFKFPERLQHPLDYWQMYAARLDMHNHNFKDAIARLTPISKGNGEYQVSARALLDTVRSYETRSLAVAFDTDPYKEMPTRLHEAPEPCVMQDLLQQCIHLCQSQGPTEWNMSALKVLLQQSDGVAPSVLAEAYRLNGQCDKAIPLFYEAIQLHGHSVQATAGLAECMHDSEAMRHVSHSTSPNDTSAYWYWLSNVRLLQWFIDDGGNPTIAIAKINRLRKKDASLGGAQFMSQFNTLTD